MVSALSPAFQNFQIGARVIFRIVRGILRKAPWPKRFVVIARMHQHGSWLNNPAGGERHRTGMTSRRIRRYCQTKTAKAPDSLGTD